MSVYIPNSIGGSRPGDPDETTAARYGDLLGVSSAMLELFAYLSRLETSKMNVLVSGESGTGKELIARALHDHSPVRDGPFVALNCGALDRLLVRSELFGHLRGAFTGAVRTQRGAFEAANGGTLFLDEIGELPCDIQPVLLRALELKRITPLGSNEERQVDVRLVTATNRNLAAEVQAGNFREDLFYRIHVVHLVVPPLRDRPDDVRVLAQDFARQLGATGLPPSVLEAFTQHRWPGNVRQLRNAVEAYLALGIIPQSSLLGACDDDAAFERFVDATKTYTEQKSEILQRFTRVYLQGVLRRTGGNQSEAARVSGLERSYLGKLIDKLGLRTEYQTTLKSSPTSSIAAY